MADADVAITAGAGTKIDTRTVGAGTDEHRQVVVIGDPTTAASVAIVDAQGHLLAHESSPTATLSNVAASATSVTVLALNTSRTGATVANDSTALLYVKLGTTASTTSYTVKLRSGDYYEVPFGYTGRIDGIWATANGNARITELT